MTKRKQRQLKRNPPVPVSTTCQETLEIGDDFMDNHATMHCELLPSHDGRHRETFFDGQAVVEWDTGAASC